MNPIKKTVDFKYQLKSISLRVIKSHYLQRVSISLIVSSIVSVLFLAMDSSHENLHIPFFYFTLLSSFFFTIEYIIRLLVADAKYPSLSHLRARFQYATSFFGIVDFVAILPFVLIYFLGSRDILLLNLAHTFIFFKILRYSKSLRLVGQAFQMVKHELITTATALWMLMFFFSIVVYQIEKEAQPEVFRSIGDGLWWSVVTFTTLGYGDLFPITPLGRIVASIYLLIGVVMMAIPTALISSAFISILNRRRREKSGDEPFCPNCGQSIFDDSNKEDKEL